MKSNESFDVIRKRVLLLIGKNYSSDAAFERAAGLVPKTVNNWRRRISNSYLKMLPNLAELFHMEIGELVSEEEQVFLTPDEKQLLVAYRDAKTLSSDKQQLLYELLSQLAKYK